MSSFDYGLFLNKELPGQCEVMSSWLPGQDVKVSVVVTSYNHDLYLSDCLKGILLQKTNFPFEVIIHDDASTDSTKTILNSFAESYPNIIRCIMQSENQYSKGCNKPLLNAFSVCVGDYIAICEGDDFWFDCTKLQHQFDVIENNVDCSLVVHQAYVLKGLKSYKPNVTVRDFRFDASNILLCFGQFAPTASYFFKRVVVDVLPDWFESAPIGDFLIEMYSQKIGFGLYLSDSYSVYRYLSVGSWSSNTSQDNNARMTAIEGLINIIDKIAKDFPENIMALKSRKQKSYAALAFQLTRLNIKKIFNRYYNLEYQKIRAIASQSSPSGYFRFLILFPPVHFLFIVNYSIAIMYRRALGQGVF